MTENRLKMAKDIKYDIPKNLASEEIYNKLGDHIRQNNQAIGPDLSTESSAMQWLAATANRTAQ
jgi:hypothetical protein